MLTVKQSEIIVESVDRPRVGDGFFIEAGDLLIETEIIRVDSDGIIIKLDEEAKQLLLQHRRNLVESRIPVDLRAMGKQARSDSHRAARTAKSISSGKRGAGDMNRDATRAYRAAKGVADIEAKTADQEGNIKESSDRVSHREDYGTAEQRKKYIDKLVKHDAIDRSDCAHMTLPELKAECKKLDKQVDEGKPGLWDNIRAKRARIKSGSGERMRKPGSKGAPTDKTIADIRASTSEGKLEEYHHEEGVRDHVDEAKYQGREVPLGKPMKGDVKKSKVYVRSPKGNVVKVNFGDKNMRIKKSNPARRKSFRARHNCKNPGPRTSARYWSCRAW